MKLKIEKLIYEGYGLGRTKDKPVFVSKSVPGDELEVKILKDNKSFQVGSIKKVISPSPKRIEPKCKHFDECGGCDHQNINYPDQLKLKDEIFKEVLSRAKINITSESIIPGSNHPFFYRNSIRFFIKKINDKIEFCRHHYITNDLIPIQECFLQSETANKVLTDLKTLLSEKDEIGSLYQIKIRQGKMTGDFMVELITNSEELANKDEILSPLKSIDGIKSIYHTVTPAGSLRNARRHLVFGSAIIFEKVGKYTFQISPESFFQTNSLGIKTLYDVIKDFAKVDIRVAEILKAENVEGSDKLLELEVNSGLDTRTIIAGLAHVYKPEELVGKKILLVANLKPAKIFNKKSNGMLLAAKLKKKDNPVLIEINENIPVGAKLS